jgi:hypothetical protein
VRTIKSNRVAGAGVAAGLCVAAAVVVSMATAPAGQGRGIERRVSVLEDQVAALTEQLAAMSQPLRLDVNCDGGERIQSALDRSQHHPTPVIIRVFGVCHENLVIRRTDLLIFGGAPGAGITGSPGQPVVRPELFSPVPSFGLTGLTLTGGAGGVVADFGAHVRLANCRIRGTSIGVRADHGSLVRLENTVVEQNSNDGVLATNGAAVYMTGGVIRNNGAHGLHLQAGASAEASGAATVAANNGNGVLLEGNSRLHLGAATITESAFTGVHASGASLVYLSSGATITANTMSGITLLDTSLVQKFRAEANIHVTSNGGYGIVCSVPPAVAQVVGFTFQQGDVSGNALGNIDCPISPGPKAQ